MVPGAETCDSFHDALVELVSDLNVCSNKGVAERIARRVATGFDHEKVYLSFQEYVERLRDVPERWGKPMAAVLGALMAQVELGSGAFGGKDSVELGSGAFGGKDSMSGSFEDLDVPPTLVSFAVAVDTLANVVSPEFTGAGHRVALIQPTYQVDDLLPEPASLLTAFRTVESLVREGKALSVSTDTLANVVSPEFTGAGHRVALIQPTYQVDDLLPEPASLLTAFRTVESLVREGKALSVSTAGFGGLAEILFKACLGNRIGFEVSEAYYEADARDLFDHSYGCFVVELDEGAALPEADRPLLRLLRR